MLKDSRDPSQREWAAQQLARPDLRSHPPLLQALISAAREDPAVAVRAVCRKLLADAGIFLSAESPMPKTNDPWVRCEAKAGGPSTGTIAEE